MTVWKPSLGEHKLRRKQLFYLQVLFVLLLHFSMDAILLKENWQNIQLSIQSQSDLFLRSCCLLVTMRAIAELRVTSQLSPLSAAG